MIVCMQKKGVCECREIIFVGVGVCVLRTQLPAKALRKMAG